MTQILTDISKGRDRGAPYLAIDTPDMPALIQQAAPLFEGPVLVWDRVRGLRAHQQQTAALTYLRRISTPMAAPASGRCPDCHERHPMHVPGCETGENTQPFPLASTVDLVTTLDLLGSTNAHKRLPAGGVVFVQGAHRYMDDPAVVQALLNARDLFKLPQHRTVVILLGPGMRVGGDLANDVVTYVEALPTHEQAQELVLTQYENAGLDAPVATELALVVDAVIGLSAFSIEQVVALSLTTEGIDLQQCWERKAAVIESVDGLRLYYGGPENFSTVVAQQALQEDFVDFMGAPDAVPDVDAPAVFVWIDEGEKLFAGSRGDLSGTYQDHEAVLLTRLQESKALGAIIFGVSGGGKSAGVKSLGGQFKRPIVIYDAGAMQGSLVGESQRKVRAAHRVIEAISGGKGKAFWLMTSNDLSGMKPEVKERFSFGTYFVDLPTREEKDQIWAVKMAEYGISDQPRPDDTGWVGRNIEACCRKAKLTKRPLVYVAETIIGYGVSNPDAVEKMRQQADGMMLSAHKRGVYRRATETAAPAATISVKTTGGAKRQIKFN